MRRDAKPYLCPDTDGIGRAPWERWDGSDWAPLESEVEGWDPDTDLVVRRLVEADWGLIRYQAGLPADFPLTVTGSWSSSTSQMRSPIGSVIVPTVGRVLVEGIVPGRMAGGVLEVTTTVATATDWHTAPAGVARYAGSVFFRESVRVQLESSGGLFPVAMVDFAHTRFDPDASWHLNASHDLSSPFMGTFLLYINQRDGELVDAITAPKPSPAQRLLVQEVHHQVAMTMLEIAADAEQNEDLLDVDWPADTVGDVLKNLWVAAGDRRPPPDPADRRTWLAGAARRGAHGRAIG